MYPVVVCAPATLGAAASTIAANVLPMSEARTSPVTRCLMSRPFVDSPAGRASDLPPGWLRLRWQHTVGTAVCPSFSPTSQPLSPARHEWRRRYRVDQDTTTSEQVVLRPPGLLTDLPVLVGDG